MDSRRGASLLDVNVLIALFSPSHVHHEIAHDWLSDHGSRAWATCPLTENGFLRTTTRDADERERTSIGDAVHRLRRFRRCGRHEFWPDDFSLTDVEQFHANRMVGHQQLTDLYLLALAVRHNGTLVTLDRRIPVIAVRNATPGHLSVLAVSDDEP